MKNFIHYKISVLGLLVVLFSGCAGDEASQTIIPKNTDNIIKIITMGDSLTEGYGLKNPNEDSYPAQLEKRLLDDGFTLEIENAGISGETSTGGLARAQWVAESDPDIILLFLGANDMLRGIQPTVTQENLSKIIDIFQAKDIKVILMPMKAQSSFGPIYEYAFNGMYGDIAKEKDVILSGFPLDTIALQPEYNLDDGIHPNQKGYKIFVDNIYPTILEVLEK